MLFPSVNVILDFLPLKIKEKMKIEIKIKIKILSAATRCF